MIVLDTSFLVALHNAQDAHHARARALAVEFDTGRWGRGALLEYVFLETMTVMLVRRNLDSAIRAGRLLLAAGDLDFVPCSELFTSIFEAFAGQPGTRLSFTDVAIAGFARRYADGHILTFDREFAKLPGLRLWPASTGDASAGGESAVYSGHESNGDAVPGVFGRGRVDAGAGGDAAIQRGFDPARAQHPAGARLAPNAARRHQD